jgi:hypothetical protein
MTMPNERTRSVLQTRQFLEELAGAKVSGIPEEVRVEARRLLRHFPETYDLVFSAEACPDLWARPEPKQRFL